MARQKKAAANNDNGDVAVSPADADADGTKKNKGRAGSSPSLPPSSSSSPLDLTGLIMTRFDGHQRRGRRGDNAAVDNAAPTMAAAHRLKGEIRRLILPALLLEKEQGGGDDNGDGEEENRDPQRGERRSRRRREDDSKDEEGSEDEEEEDDEVEEAMDEIREEIGKAVAQCVNAAFFASTLSSSSTTTTTTPAKKKKSSKAAATTASENNNKDTSEAIESILDLAAAFSASADGPDMDFLNNTAFSKVWNIAAEATKASIDTVRSHGCALLGKLLNYLVSTLLLLEKKRKQQKQKPSGGRSKNQENRNEDDEEEEEEDEDDEEWILSCFREARKALLPRLTDKSQAVRNVAIRACANFFLPHQFSAAAETKTTGMLLSFPGVADEQVANKIITGELPKVREALCATMAHDPSFANRSSALYSVPVDRKTVPCIVERVADVKDKVRIDALAVLKDKVKLEMLTRQEDDEEQEEEEEGGGDYIAQVLQYGLTERCNSTYEAGCKLIGHGWLKTVKFDPIALLRKIDPVIHETESESVVRVLLELASEDDVGIDRGGGGGRRLADAVLADLSPPEKRALRDGIRNAGDWCWDSTSRGDKDDDDDNRRGLDEAEAFYLRRRCDAIANSSSLSPAQREKRLGEIVPDLWVLCEVLQKHLGLLIASASNRRGRTHSKDDDSTDLDITQEDKDKDTSNSNDNDVAEAFEERQSFIGLQLLHVIARTACLAEEGGRRQVRAFLQDMLRSSDTPEEHVEPCLLALEALHPQPGTEYLHLVSNVIEKVAPTDDADRRSDEAESRYVRALSIMSVALERSRVPGSNPIYQVFTDVTLSCVTNTSSRFVRELAVTCLGKFCILADGETVNEKYRPLLLRIAANEEECGEVRARAILSLCDLALLLSESITVSKERIMGNVSDDDDEPPSLGDILAEQIRDLGGALTAVVAECCMKLMLVHKMREPYILACLLTVYFNVGKILPPDSSADDARELGSRFRLEQLLSVFFHAYAMSGSESRGIVLNCVPHLLRIFDENRGGGDDVSKNKKRRGGHKTTKSMKSQQSLLPRILDYVCAIMDLGGESAGQGNLLSNAADGTQTEVGDTAEVQPASRIEVMIHLASFLLDDDDSSSLSVPYLRSLCKIMGGTKASQLGFDVDDENEDGFVLDDDATLPLLKSLKSKVEKLNMTTTDHYALSSLEKLSGLLDPLGDAVDDDDASGVIAGRYEEHLVDEDNDCAPEEDDASTETDCSHAGDVDSEGREIATDSLQSLMG